MHQLEDLFVLVLLALALALVACDQEPEPTCADWLACYDECRLLELDGADLNPCLMECPPAFVPNPVFGVPEVEWTDDLLELRIERGEDAREALRDVIRARGECAAWKS